MEAQEKKALQNTIVRLVVEQSREKNRKKILKGIFDAFAHIARENLAE